MQVTCRTPSGRLAWVGQAERVRFRMFSHSDRFSFYALRLYDASHCANISGVTDSGMPAEGPSDEEVFNEPAGPIWQGPPAVGSPEAQAAPPADEWSDFVVKPGAGGKSVLTPAEQRNLGKPFHEVPLAEQIRDGARIGVVALAEVIHDPKASHSVRVDAAKWFLEKHAGKPKQEVENTHSSLNDFISLVRELKSMGSAPAHAPGVAASAQSEPRDVSPTPLIEARKSDPIDALFEELEGPIPAAR